MSRKSNGIKLEHGIWYYEKADTYIIRGQSGKTYGFPTYEDAKKFYEQLKQSKIKSKLLEERERIRKRDERIIAQAMPYPFNVAKAANLSDSDILTIEEARVNLMSDRDRKIFDLYFKEDKTLDEIGHKYGVTGARAGQVLKRCLKLISYAKEKKIADERKKESLEEKRREAIEISECRKKLIEIFRETGVYGEDMVIEFGPVTSRKSASSSLLLEKIDSLHLSVRSNNCLRRAGIHRIGQLVEKTPDEILQIKNLGKRSFREILDKLEENELTLKGE